MSKPSYYVPNTINKASLDEVKEVLKKLSEILDSSFSIFIQFRTWGEEKERQSDLLILTKNGIYNLEVKNYREVIKICYPGEWVVTNNKKVKNPLKQSEDTADNVQKYLQEKADKIFSEKRKQELFKRILKVFPLLLLLTPSGSVNKNKISSRCILLNGINDLENYFKKNRATWHLYEGNSLTLDNNIVDKIAKLYYLSKVQDINSLFETASKVFVLGINDGVKQVYNYTCPAVKEAFFDREEEINTIISIIKDKQNFLVTGERSIGKTSLAKQIEILCEEEKLAVPCYIDFKTLRYDDEKNLLVSFLGSIVKFVIDRYGGDFYQSISFIYQKFENMNSGIATNIFFNVIDDIYKSIKNFLNAQILFLFDNFDMLRNYKDSGFQEYFVSSITNLYDNYGREEKGVIFGVFTLEFNNYTGYEKKMFEKIPRDNIIKLSKFDNEVIKEFLKKTGELSGVSYSNDAINKICEITKGHPHYLQQICYIVLNMIRGSGTNIVSKEVVEEAIKQKQLTLRKEDIGE